MQPFIDAIRTARDPAAARAALDRAIAAAPDADSPYEAFLRRIVELGRPLLATEQARTLLGRAPRNGLALAVLAYAAAAEQDTATALDEIMRAAQNAPTDPFVQRTAGQILAWYDTRGEGFVLTPAERRAIQRIRNLLSGRKVYADAFREAHEMYQRAQAAEATAPPAQTPDTEPPQPPQPEQPLYPPYGPYGYPPYGYGPYGYGPYIYGPWAFGFYGYPGGYIGSYGYYPGAFVVGGYGYHNRRYDGSGNYVNSGGDMPVRNPPYPTPQLWGGGRPQPNPPLWRTTPGLKPNSSSSAPGMKPAGAGPAANARGR